MIKRDYEPILSGLDCLLSVIPEGELSSECRYNTPIRFRDSFREMVKGYDTSPVDVLTTYFDIGVAADQVIMAGNLRFESLCAHHLLPFHGVTHIAYIPNNGIVVGLSKIPRLLECRSRRLQLQETLGAQIADDMEKALSPVGVAVVIVSRHDCMNCRGVKSRDGEMITSVMRGAFRDNKIARQELMMLLGMKSG